VQMNANTAQSVTTVGQVGTNWNVDGAGDFNRDGDSDILLHRDSGGVRNLLAFEMQGNAVQAAHNIGQLGADWQIGGLGDFDHDADGDVLLFRESGGIKSLLTLEMENNAVQAAHNIGQIGANWQIDRVADFDGDADQDVLLHSDAGGLRSLLVLEMNGGAIAAGHVIGQLGTNWQIDGAGDFDRDGDSDILLHRDVGGTRNLLTLEMNGNVVQAGHSIGAMGTDFQIGGIGDFDHDGDADISVRHESTATEVTILEMNNDAIVAAHNAVNLGPDFFLV
jgi:hypothetical protein